MLDDGGLEAALIDRYAGWEQPEAIDMLANGDLESIADRVEADDINPTPQSGRQEVLENYVSRFI